VSLPQQPAEYRVNLADSYGPWCAWCLQYLCPSPPTPCAGLDVHRHHMIRRNWIELNLTYSRRDFRRHPLEWTVFVHEACHRGRATRGSPPTLQSYTDAISRNLQGLDPNSTDFLGEDRLAKLQERFNTLDERARETHEAGLYQLSMVFKGFRSAVQERIEKRPGPTELGAQEVGSLAGVRHRTPLKLPARDALERDPRLAYHLANYFSDRGMLQEAVATLEKGDEELRRSSARAQDEYATDRLLRHAQVLRSANAAAEALSEEREGYRAHTALVMTAWVEFGRGRYGGSLEAADALLSPTTSIAWLFRAEGCFAKAATMLSDPLVHGPEARERNRQAYQFLVQAQYICVLLGLQATPHPEVRDRLHMAKGDVRQQWSTTPGDVLLESGGFDRLAFAAKELAELRVEAILASGLRTQIIASLVALSEAPPLAGVLWHP
jgi:hypothetical protein